MNHTTRMLSILALVVIITGCGGPKTFTGTYQGTCHNTTVKLDANIVLILVAHPDNTVSGNINITGDLSGTGPITGLIDGDKVTFTSNEKGTGMTITWRGTLRKGRIEGRYLVSVNAWNKLFGNTDQDGYWVVDKLQ